MRAKTYVAIFEGEEVEYMTDGHGLIMSHRNWESLKKVMDEIYENHTPEQVKAHNDSVTKELYKENMEANARAKSEVIQKKEKPGYVYFIEYEGHGVKIGYSVNVNNRMKQLQTASPNKLTLIASYKSEVPSVHEKMFHDYFSKDKIRGEWYKVTLEDIEKFVGVLNG